MNADNKGGSSSRLLDASKSAPATPNLTSTRAALAFVDRPIHLACLIVPFLLASCTTPKDVQHHVVISVNESRKTRMPSAVISTFTARRKNETWDCRSVTVACE